jgi:hypothetical protein
VEETRDLGHVTFTEQDMQSHGYAVPLKEWPPGPYLLRVSVTDRIGQVTTTRDLVFQVQ